MIVNVREVISSNELAERSNHGLEAMIQFDMEEIVNVLAMENVKNDG